MTQERTKEEILALGVRDPEFEAYIKQNGAPKRPSNDVYANRKMMEKNVIPRIMQQPIPEGIEETDITVRAQDGYEIPCRVHKPQNSSGCPLIVVLHPGGFSVGGPFQEYANCRRLVKAYGVVCVNVDYRLAPENQFPIPVNDCYDVLKWVAEHAKELGADANQGFLIGGTSSGANMSSVCAHRAKDDGLSPPLTGIYMVTPMVMASDEPPERYREDYLSWEQNKDAIFLDREAIDFFSRNYAPDRKSHLYSSVHADHRGLPRVFIQAGGGDAFRDDALIYEKMLRNEAGVETKLEVYPGMPHGFLTQLPALSQTKKALEDNVRGIGWLLRKNAY